MAAVQQAGSFGGEHILFNMQGVQVMALAECLTAGDQCRVVFQAGELLAGLQQASAQVSFAGAPVEPVSGRLGEFQAAGERFDLLPFAPRHIDIQAVPGFLQRMGR